MSKSSKKTAKAAAVGKPEKKNKQVKPVKPSKKDKTGKTNDKKIAKPIVELADKTVKKLVTQPVDRPAMTATPRQTTPIRSSSQCVHCRQPLVNNGSDRPPVDPEGRWSCPGTNGSRKPGTGTHSTV